MAFENDPFSLDVRAGVADDMKKYGMKAVVDDKLPRDLSDMTATMTKIKALKPDLFVLSGHSKGAATAARQMKEMKIKVPMVALTHCESSKIIDKFGASTEGILCPTQGSETLSYEGRCSAKLPTMTATSRRPMPDTRTCPIKLRRLQLRCRFGKMRSSAPTALTAKSFAWL